MTDMPEKITAWPGEVGPMTGAWSANQYFDERAVGYTRDDLITPSLAAQDVIAERRRQIEGEGWTPEDDDIYVSGQLARAGACYVLAGGARDPAQRVLIEQRENLDYLESSIIGRFWPFDQNWWKPTSRRRDLVKAAALILAEIERLDRVSAAAGGGNG